MARLSLKAEAQRYYLGYLWWVLEPLLWVGVFYVVFYELLGSITPDFLMFLAVLTVFGVLVSDILLAMLDPRIRLGGSATK